MTKTVLLLGSAPDAVRARSFSTGGLAAIVAINNAWRIRPDWTHLVHAGDFPDERKPEAGPGQTVLSFESYVPANNAFGGIVYAGGTMAFSAGYWALHALRPDILAFCGCDMVYGQPGRRTHFYGAGAADPLRKDPTLQSLEAKSTRLMHLAAREGCLCVNLSEQADSRLVFPRMPAARLGMPNAEYQRSRLADIRGRTAPEAVEAALAREAELGAMVPSGDYWNHPDRVDAGALAEIDRLWLEATPAAASRPLVSVG